MVSYGRLVVCSILLPMAFGALVPPLPSVGNLPGTLGRFIDECFERNVRTLYLVGLEELPNYWSYLALPYLKVIVPRNASIGMPDRTCLVVIYFNSNSQESLQKSMDTIMQGRSTQVVPNGKYLVLTEDGNLAKQHMVVPIVLGILFAKHNIVYWCVTGFRRATSLQYTVPSAEGIVTIESRVQYGSLYEWDRGQVANTIIAQAVYIFPFTHRINGGSFRGIDVDIFNSFRRHFNFKLHVRVLQQIRDTVKDRESIFSSLERMQIDVMMTRRDVESNSLPLVYVPGVSYYCLIVPRSTVLDLMQSLWRPFSRELWVCVIVGGLLISGLSELTKREPRVASLLVRVFSRKPLISVLTSSYAIFRFILVESYLAKVTAFFLIFRFQPDAKTLDEFFAKGIPIWLPAQYDQFVELLSDDVRPRVRERAVDARACGTFWSTCAHIDSFARAAYSMSYEVPIDPVSARKLYYIVPEMLIGYSHLAYAFGRGSSLANLFAVYLRWLEEAGLVQLYHRRYEQYLRPDQQAYTPVDQSLLFGHFMPIWICIGLGWCVSLAVFVLELFPFRMVKEKLGVAMRTLVRRVTLVRPKGRFG